MSGTRTPYPWPPSPMSASYPFAGAAAGAAAPPVPAPAACWTCPPSPCGHRFSTPAASMPQAVTTMNVRACGTTSAAMPRIANSPGDLLAVTGLVAILGIAADVVPQARTFIVVTAWGIDAAGVLNLWPQGLGGQVQQAAGAGTGGAAAPAAAPANG